MFTNVRDTLDGLNETCVAQTHGVLIGFWLFGHNPPQSPGQTVLAVAHTTIGSFFIPPLERDVFV